MPSATKISWLTKVVGPLMILGTHWLTLHFQRRVVMSVEYVKYYSYPESKKDPKTIQNEKRCVNVSIISRSATKSMCH